MAASALLKNKDQLRKEDCNYFFEIKKNTVL